MRDPAECLDDLCRLCVYSICRALAAGRRGEDDVRATRRGTPCRRSRVSVAGDPERRRRRCAGSRPRTIGRRSTRRPGRPPPRRRGHGARREHRRLRSQHARDASAGPRLRLAGVAIIVAGILAAALALALRSVGRIGIRRVEDAAGTDIPVAIAVARDGMVWFTIDSSNAIGRLKDGRIEKVRKPTDNLEPLGLAADADGSAWYTDAHLRAISRVSNDGTITSFDLATPVARLGRLALAPDGAVWFAESTAVSVTRLQDGRFTRHAVGSAHRGGGGQCRAVRDCRRRAGNGLGDAPECEQARAHRCWRGDDGVRAANPPERTRGCRRRPERRGVGSGGRREQGRAVRCRAVRGVLRSPPPTRGSPRSPWPRTAPRGSRKRVPTSSAACAAASIKEFALPRRDARPFGVAVDGANNVWYTDLSGWLGMLRGDRARAE